MPLNNLIPINECIYKWYIRLTQLCFIKLFNILENNPNSIFVSTNFGGHLGCYTGKWNKIDPLTLLEPMIIEYLNAVIHNRIASEKCK